MGPCASHALLSAPQFSFLCKEDIPSTKEGRQDQLYNLQSPVQNENGGPLFKIIKNLKMVTAEHETKLGAR